MERVLVPLLSGAVSYSACAICLASVPATHAVGLYLHSPPGAARRPWRFLLYPFTGGGAHCALQLLGWVLWAFSLLALLPVHATFLPGVAPKRLPLIPHTHLDAVSGAAAVVSFVAELFMVKAVLVYDGDRAPAADAGDGAGSGKAVAHRGFEPMPHAASAAVAVMGGMLTLTSFLLLMALDYMPDIPSRVLYCCLSLSCLLIAVSTTYGLGGFLRYQQAARRRRRRLKAAAAAAVANAASGTAAGDASPGASPGEPAGLARRRKQRRPPSPPGCESPGSARGGGGESDGEGEGEGEAEVEWQFFQPFSGGPAFVAAQAIGWSFFSAAVVLVAVILGQAVRGVASCARGWALGAGSAMVAAQTALAISLALFRQSPATLLRAASRALGADARPPAALAPPARKPRPSPLANSVAWFHLQAPVVLMYCPVHLFFALWTVSFTFLPLNVAAAAWAVFLVPYYTLSSLGDFAHTGCREWGWLQAWFSARIEPSLAHWFGAVAVIYDGNASDRETHARTAAVLPPLRAEGARGAAAEAAAAAITAEARRLAEAAGSLESKGAQQQAQQQQMSRPADSQASLSSSSSDSSSQSSSSQSSQSSTPEGRLILGFHPHGFYPTGAGFLPMLESFRARLPGVKPSTLVANALFAAPFLRDVAAWSGFRRVTRTTFLRALRERGAVVLCPGGQAEMCHTHRMYRCGTNGSGGTPELVVHARHKGFCKIAIEQQASLLPVLALGEALQLRNLVHLPALQAYTTRRFRFPFPFWLGGRWGVSPLPSKVPLVYVVGEPIPPPPLRAGEHGPNPSDVDALHTAYFGALADLFRRYRHTHPHFEGAQLVMAYD